MASIFDSTIKYNGEVVIRAINNLKSKTNIKLVPYLMRNRDMRLEQAFPAEGGGNIASILISGDLGGTAQNYDGSTTLVPSNVVNFSQKVVVIGRANSWKEKDFVLSIAGKSELDGQVYQVAMARDKNVKDSAISILTALFDGTNGVLRARTQAFTTDPTGVELNQAVVAGCGDLANDFDVVVMDSYIAELYANLKLLNWAKYNDEEGLERVSHEIAYLGGKLVIVDDAVGGNARTGVTHNVYALASRSFIYAEGLVKYPFEWGRDSLTAGGVDMFISRQRYVLAPYGVDWAGSASIVSPTEVQLATATNWALITDGAGNAIDGKLIPFAHCTFTLS